MTYSTGNIIADSCRLCLSYTEKLLTDIPPELFARFAAPGGEPIASNHPAFVLGHLSLYPPRIVRAWGQERGLVDVPTSFETVFSKDVQCEDDPDGSIYPHRDTIVEAFFQGYRTIIDRLRELDEEVLQRANPNEAMAKRFPTLGSMHAFYCGGHLMVHLGQLSAWRRMAGLGSA